MDEKDLPPLPDFAAKVLSRLKEELPAFICYHDVIHTGQVLSRAQFLSKEEGLEERHRHLLLIAAAFHDSGFLLNPTGARHEQAGAALAAEAMRGSGAYSEKEIESVSQAILDTKLTPEWQQVANTPLSPCLLDADLSSLGQPDWLERSELLRKELGTNDIAAYHMTSLQLLRAHRWQTKAAARFWQEEKEKNLARLMALLKA